MSLIINKTFLKPLFNIRANRLEIHGNDIDPNLAARLKAGLEKPKNVAFPEVRQLSEDVIAQKYSICGLGYLWPRPTSEIPRMKKYPRKVRIEHCTSIYLDRLRLIAVFSTILVSTTHNLHQFFYIKIACHGLRNSTSQSHVISKWRSTKLASAQYSIRMSTVVVTLAESSILTNITCPASGVRDGKSRITRCIRTVFT